MPTIQADRSPDLKRLMDERYCLDIYGDYLVIRNVPYVDGGRKVKLGLLASDLQTSEGVTVRPDSHVAYWAGDYPCDNNGIPLKAMDAGSGEGRKVYDGMVADYTFSQKPKEGYNDYYEKMTYYVRRIENFARAIDPSVSARAPGAKGGQAESVFRYSDASLARDGISDMSGRARGMRVAIAGMGGTGSYVLDLVAKTEVREIHLFDGDAFLQHNAFRSPGAPAPSDFADRPKTEWFAGIYSRMREGVIPHAENVGEGNIGVLKGMDFVFVCVDGGKSRGLIAEYLTREGIPFADTGMGLRAADGKITGQARVTAHDPESGKDVLQLMPRGGAEDSVYSTNIQIAEINALSAALAVIRWKKSWGFYRDTGREHNTVYAIETNEVINGA